MYKVSLRQGGESMSLCKLFGVLQMDLRCPAMSEDVVGRIKS